VVCFIFILGIRQKNHAQKIHHLGFYLCLLCTYLWLFKPNKLTNLGQELIINDYVIKHYYKINEGSIWCIRRRWLNNSKSIGKINEKKILLIKSWIIRGWWKQRRRHKEITKRDKEWKEKNNRNTNITWDWIINQ
jgi:hypothetical protein